MSAQPDSAGRDLPESGRDCDSRSRTVVIDAAILLLREQPLHSMTLATVADAAHVDLAEVSTHFPTLEDLVAEVVDVWYSQRLQPLLRVAKQHGAVASLRNVLAANIDDPALLRLMTASVSIAATDVDAALVLQARWIRFHATVQRALVHDITVGREPETMNPARGAEQLIALYEGLQLQSMLRPQMNVIEAYDRAVSRLRSGWSSAYPPPVWTI